MSVRLSCPFCNSAVEVASVPASRRVACPRCGESFPVRVSPDQPGPSHPVDGAVAPPAVAQARPAAPGRSLPPLLGLGLAAAVLAVGIGLFLVFGRGGPGEPTGPSRSLSATVPPAGVAGLAYLPDETGVAAAVQAGPLLAYADRTQTDPRKLLAEVGIASRLLATLDRLGLTLEQIDHVFAGIVISAETAFPRVVLGLVLTRPPADEAAFLRQLKATQYTTPAGATRYKGIDLGIPLPIELARVDATTYVFASDPKDLESTEARTGRGSAHLAGGLRESLGRLSPAAVAWLATDVAAWEDRPIVKLLAEGAKKPEVRKQLRGIRAAAAGLSLEPDPTWSASVRGADTAAVRRLEDLAKSAAGDPAAGSAVRVDDLWVTVEGPAATTWLQKLLPTSPK